MEKLIRIHANDNVAVAILPVSAGETAALDNVPITATQDIPQGHKIALRPVVKGENIIKYGVPIGSATVNIEAGEWVHTHNMRTNLEGEVSYAYDPVFCQLPTAEPAVFQGYRRADGRAAIRNEIWIIPTVGCVNGVVKALERSCQDLVTGSIDGLYAFTHPFGCSQTGDDHEQTRKLLTALVSSAGGRAWL